jgi:hypothetical protein
LVSGHHPISGWAFLVNKIKRLSCIYVNEYGYAPLNGFG